MQITKTLTKFYPKTFRSLPSTLSVLPLAALSRYKHTNITQHSPLLSSLGSNPGLVIVYVKFEVGSLVPG